MRCQVCHDPDTWKMDGGTEYTADALLEKALRFRKPIGERTAHIRSAAESHCCKSTFSGAFQKAKQQGVHTVMNSAEILLPEKVNFSGNSSMMEVTDLLLLDLKEINAERHRKLTGQEN